MIVSNRNRLMLLAIAAIYVAMFVVGITWGLPSRAIDPYLFGDEEPWSGEKIYRLAKAGEKLSEEAILSRGADVDVDPVRAARGPHRVDDELPARPPLPHGRGSEDADGSENVAGSENASGSDVGREDEREPILLTATEEDVARIYLRYRLYTYQPDEMITMMALAGMRPGELKFDPRLYQYGGLWIYPVGALIKLCGIVGLIDVRSDLVFYLDNPDEFGKFYVVARAYAAAWGLLGVFVVFGITRRLVGGKWDPDDTKVQRERRLENEKHLDQVEIGSATQIESNRQDARTPSGESTEGGEGQSQVEVRQSPISDLRFQISDFKTQHRAAGAGVLAALLFALMPVVVCMAHEGKPHLPGAVLMLVAVYLGMRCVATKRPAKADRLRDGATKGVGEGTGAQLYGDSAGEQRSSLPGGGTTQGSAKMLFASTGEDDVSFGSAGASPSQGRQDRQGRLAPADGVNGISHSAFFWLMCVACGAAVGMVLSSGPILVLVPVVAWMQVVGSDAATRQGGQAVRRSDAVQSRISYLKSHMRLWFLRTIAGSLLAVAVYIVTNPYVVINAFVNREVLASNFGNSLGMYEIARVGEGFLRVLELTVEGATLPIVVLGFAALAIAIFRRDRIAIPLIVAAGVFFLQFVLIGAGKPAEYGRFGIFPNTALAIGTAILLTRRWTRFKVNWVPAVFVTAWVAVMGGRYAFNFWVDTTVESTRIRAYEVIRGKEYFNHIPPELFDFPRAVYVLSDPAPYCCPPIPFNQTKVLLYGSEARALPDAGTSIPAPAFVRPIESAMWFPWSRWNYREVKEPSSLKVTPISWANKPFRITWFGHTVALPR